MKKNILLFTLIILSFNFLKAQQVQKGFGTSNSTFLFGYTSYAAKSQCIFWPSDFTNLAAGTITRIYYKYGTGAGDQVLTRFSIQMGQTTETAFTSSTFFTGLTPVYYRDSDTIPQGVSGNWFYFDLDTPFTYDSTKTLIVQLIFPESAIDSWGTLGSSNNPAKKMISPDTLATTGDPTSSTWQDFGFDLATASGIYSFISKTNGFDFLLAPNPAQNDMLITTFNSALQTTDLSITTLLGETVYTQKLTTNSAYIDINNLSNGIYFVTLTDQQGKVKSKKFIIEK